MKHQRIVLFLMMIGIFNHTYSQEYADYKPQWPESHIIINEECPLLVAKISNWAPEYLTVVDNFYNWLFFQAPPTLDVMCVITEINGQSTKSMTPESFYAIMYEATTITLKYLKKTNGKNIEYNETMTKPRGCGLVENWGRDMDRQWTLTDEDVDFFQFNTYDYVINEDVNRLEQKQLLKKMADVLESKGLVRSTSNPDIYLYVSLSSTENIESVYQPRTITTTSSDTYSKSNVYSYTRNNRKYGDVNTNSNTTTRTTTRDVGTMKTYVNTDAYLEVTILDAKRTDQSTAPRVWQFKYEGRIDGSVNLSTYENWIHNNAKIYPFGSNTKYKPKIHLGRDDNNKSCFYGLYIYHGKVSYILKNSFAEKEGINVGDTLAMSGGKPKKNSVLISRGNGNYSILKGIGKIRMKRSILSPSYMIENNFIASW